MRKMFNGYIYHFKDNDLQKINIESQFKTLDEFIMNLPAGVYSTLRTVGNKKGIFQLTYHLHRLLESFQLAGYEFIYSIYDLKLPLHEIISREKGTEVRLRIFLPFDSPQICYLLTEELTQPSISDYQNGVKVGINRLTRDNPRAKLTSFIHRSEKIKSYCKENNLEESIMVNKKDELLEGLSSNFFAIKEGKIFTAEYDVLKGSIREILLDVIRSNNIPLVLKPIHLNDLNTIEEAFITSTSRAVLPVVQIGDVIIGEGKPGQITTFLGKKFNERLMTEAEFV